MHPHASESPIVTTHLGPMNYSSANEEGAFDLAVELFVNIFEQLDLQSLLRCCLVCKLFQGIIKESPTIQYKIELEIAGLVDRPSVKLSIKERIISLKSYQETFKSLGLPTMWATRFDEGFYLTYCGDVALVMRCKNVEMNEQPLGQFQYDGLKACHVEPPYVTSGAPRKWWSLRTTSPFTSVCVDPSQDVIILYNQDPFSGPLEGLPLILQVLSISTGEILAGGDICVPLPNSFLGWRVTAVQIWDDMIATVMKRFDIQQSEEVILFIGWKDGIVRAQLKASIAHSNLRFLSRSRFLLDHRSFGNEFGIHLYTFNPDISSDSDNPPPPRLIAIFQLPSLSSPKTQLWISMVGLSDRGCHNYLDSRRVFETSRNKGVLGLNIFCTSEDGTTRENVLIVIDPFILRSFSPMAIQDDPEVISWASWGPRNSRFIDSPEIRPSLGPVCYGTRVLLPDKLLDFNNLDVMRDINRFKRDGVNPHPFNTYHGRSSPTRYKAGLLFREDVVSELPYREVGHAFEGPLWDICPGEDWVHR